MQIGLLLFSALLLPLSLAGSSCMETYTRCLAKETTAITSQAAGAANIFHYCESHRARVIPCTARALNLSSGASTYDRGVALYNCGANDVEIQQKLIQREAKFYLTMCVYNDIRELQRPDCFEYLDRTCGSAADLPMRECHNVERCPEYGGQFHRTLKYATRKVHKQAQVFKYGAEEEKESSPSSLPTVPLSMIALIVAALLH